MHKRICLVGLSGVGKSTIGGHLASRLGWAFLDTDAMVEARAGRSVATIIAEQGEANFRYLETHALRHALHHEPCVIATGARVVLDSQNVRLMRDAGLVFWLDAPIEVLVDRLVFDVSKRPLLGEAPGANLLQIAKERLPLYAKAGNVVYQATASAQTVAETIAKDLKTVEPLAAVFDAI